MSDIETDDRLDDGLKAKVTDSAAWTRFLYMILFGIAFQIAEVVVFAVIVVQFLFKLLAGAPNTRLAAFGRDLGIYFRQMVSFLTFDSDDMPFPLSPWPDGADTGGTDIGDTGLDDSGKSATT